MYRLLCYQKIGISIIMKYIFLGKLYISTILDRCERDNFLDLSINSNLIQIINMLDGWFNKFQNIDNLMLYLD